MLCDRSRYQAPGEAGMWGDMTFKDWEPGTTEHIRQEAGSVGLSGMGLPAEEYANGCSKGVGEG